MANTDEECSICRDIYRDDNMKKTLPCSHAFHSNCIDEWLSRKGTCPNCRARIADDRDESDSENDVEPPEVEEETVIVNGRRIPRYRGNLRYDPSVQRYITPEEGVLMYLFGKFCLGMLFVSIATLMVNAAGFLWAEKMTYSMSLKSYSDQLEVTDNGKGVKNSRASFWEGGLRNLNGIASSVPLRFFPSVDIEIQVYYKVLEKLDIGDTLLKIGFMPTRYIDKEELIPLEKFLVISAIVCEDNEICLAIINFDVTIKTIHLSDNRKRSEFVGKLILRKLQQNISVYLKTSQTTSKSKNNEEFGEQATFHTTDMPDTPAPEGVFIHTFEKIMTVRDDLWPIFVLSERKSVIASLGSHLFHEPSCNKNIFILKENYSICNKKLTGFKKCKQKPETLDSKEIDKSVHYAYTTYSLYSYNPFRFRVKSYNFSLSIEFAKSVRYENSETGTMIFLILLRPRDVHAEHFAVLGEMHDHYMDIIYENNNDTIVRDHLYFKNDFAINKLFFTFEVNYHSNKIKLEMHDQNSRKSKPHLFENIVFHESPHVIFGLSKKAIVEIKLY